jgi:DNA-binding Lrp family transcriptional regulator
MPASRETQEYIEKELPYKMLMQLYKNSRASLRKLGKDLGISYHVVRSVLKQLEEKYKLSYKLQIDETKLGFMEGQMITIKFGVRPSVDFLKNIAHKDIFIQEAFLSEGDFDLILYAVGLGPRDFQRWQWKLRTDLSEYKPVLKVATANSNSVGFLPLRSELLRETTVLSKIEKQVLVLLNDNSRMRISEIAEKTKTSANRIIYILKKLKIIGIIKNFTTLTQTPDKRLFCAYGVYLIPIKEHIVSAREFARELLNEDFHESVNDYALIANTNGEYDVFYICAFKGGEILSKRGPELLRTLWMKEEPKIEKAIITDVLFGEWPFHLEEYEYAKELLG